MYFSVYVSVFRDEVMNLLSMETDELVSIP